jgi:hypothetical protein
MSLIMFLRRPAPLLALLVAALLVAGCGQAPATFPTGTFTSTVSSEAIGRNETLTNLVGEWQLSFTPERRYTLVNKGVDIVNGSYAVSGDQITFTQESGLFVEPGSREQVTYSWSLEGGALRFTPVDETVEERRIMMTSAPWVPAP